MRRSAFTLIELMIVIAIVAIIAAIALPNLLESRVSAQETAAATALRTGLLPAQVQFQSGGYVDLDGNGIGSYAIGSTAYDLLSGNAPTPSGVTLNLLAPAFRGSNPTVSNYVFQDPVSGIGDAERVWAIVTYPRDANNGRRKFAISQVGRIFGTVPMPDASGAVDPMDSTVFGASLIGLPDSTAWRPYSR